MEKNRKNKSAIGKAGNISNDMISNGVFGQVIGGGTALIGGKKPAFTASNAKIRGGNCDIVTDPFGSWTGVSVDDPYDKPIQDADDL